MDSSKVDQHPEKPDFVVKYKGIKVVGYYLTSCILLTKLVKFEHIETNLILRKLKSIKKCISEMRLAMKRKDIDDGLPIINEQIGPVVNYNRTESMEIVARDHLNMIKQDLKNQINGNLQLNNAQSNWWVKQVSNLGAEDLPKETVHKIHQILQNNSNVTDKTLSSISVMIFSEDKLMRSRLLSPDVVIKPANLTKERYFSTTTNNEKDHGNEPEPELEKLDVVQPLVICGPSGSGKSTLLRKLMAEFGDYLGFSVSHTTRKPRAGEKDGKDYHFTTREEMEKAINNGEFIESTQFSGNYYGTSHKAVEAVQKSGKICVLDVEIEGVKNLKKSHLKPNFVFVKPPSIEELARRLQGRGTDDAESIKRRLDRASIELEYGDIDGNFDIVVVNDDLDEAYKKLRDFLLPTIEQLKKSHES